MCDVTAAVVAGTAIAGAAASSSSSKGATTKTSTVTAPWQPQQDPILHGFDAAKTNLTDGQTNTYSGPYSAGQNATQQAAAGMLTDYAQGTGTGLARGVGNTAATLLGSTDAYASNAAGLAANGAGPAQTNAQSVLNQGANGQLGIPNQNAALQPGANAAGAAGYAGAAQSMGNAGSLFAASQGDNNAATAAGAGQYVNNDLLNGQIDAANRDVARGLSDTTLPGLNARAIAGGNLNSSRAGAAAAVAERGAADRMADTASTMRSNAYNTGISAALTNSGQQNTLALGANNQLQNGSTIANGVRTGNEAQRQFDTTAQLGAATSAGALDVSNRSLNAQTQLAGNAQQGAAIGMGVNAAGAAQNLTQGNATMLGQAGNMQQAEEQRQIGENIAQVQAPQDRQAALLNNYWGVVGSQNWGGTSTGTSQTTTPPNIIGGALGGASMGMGIANGGMLGGGAAAGGALAGGNGGFGATGNFAGVNNAAAGAAGYMGLNGPAAYGAGGYFGNGPFFNS